MLVRLRDLKEEAAKSSQVFGDRELMEVEPPGGVHVSVEEARELAGSFSPVRMQQEVSSPAPTRTPACWHPDLGLPASRTVRNHSAVCKMPRL